MFRNLRHGDPPLPLTSPRAQQLGREIYGAPVSYPIQLEGIDGPDLANLTAMALAHLHEPERNVVAELVVRQAAGRALEWDRTSANLALQNLRVLTAWSGDVVPIAVSAAIFLGPESRTGAAAATARLCELAPPTTEPSYTGVTIEELLTLAAMAGPQVDEPLIEKARVDDEGSLAAMEVEWISHQGFESRWLVAMLCRYEWDESVRRSTNDRGLRSLADIPSYLDVARQILEALQSRLDDIHSGRLPFVPFKAVTPVEVPVIGRAFAAASIADQPWFAQIVPSILPRLVVAPNGGKQVPAQSLSYRLAEATRDYPTPESVNALAEAIAQVRHAQVKKNLTRQITGARRNLARAGRMASGTVPKTARDKAREQTAFRAALEASFDAPPRPVDPWLLELVGNPTLGPLASDVIWSVSDGSISLGSGLWRDGTMDGLHEPIALPKGARVRPWHPIDALPGEREEWRLRLAYENIRQPVKQAFRECYRPPEDELDLESTNMFAGIVASSRPLLAVSQKAGWRNDYDSCRLWLERGDWAFSLSHDAGLYPGVDLRVLFGQVRVWRASSAEWRAARLRDLPPVTLSEGLRSVDLIASVSAFASAKDLQAHGTSPSRRREIDWGRLQEMPLTGQDVARREALEVILGGPPSGNSLVFGDRFLQVLTRRGMYRIHYRTGLEVAPDGSVVTEEEPETPLSIPLPWLPYDEALLELIVRRTLALLQD